MEIKSGYLGRLAEGTIVFAAAFVIQELQAERSLNRQLDEGTGLFLWGKTWN